MVAITEGTCLRLSHLFGESDRSEAVRLLIEDCTPQTMNSSDMLENELERCHFAVLKLSGGNLESLIGAIALAQTDYRDLLMAAGFGNDTHAHLKWLPSS